MTRLTRIIAITITIASTTTMLPASTISAADLSSYAGTWKGTTYTASGTYSDIILTLNADGSYSCSGYPQDTTSTLPPTWTPWQTVCNTPSDKTNKWEMILPSVIRFTHNNAKLISAPMTLVSIETDSVAGKKLVLNIPSGGLATSSLSYADFTKQ